MQRPGPHDHVLAAYRRDALEHLSETAKDEAIRFAEAELTALGGSAYEVTADGEQAILNLQEGSAALVTADTTGAEVQRTIGPLEPVVVKTFRPTNRPADPPRATIEITGSRLAHTIKIELVISSDLDNAAAAVRAAFGGEA